MNALSKFPVVAACLAAAACFAAPQARAMSFTYTLISIPGAVVSEATAINNHGTVVGYYEDIAALRHGFFLKNGVVTTVDAPGATGGTTLTGIDRNGTVIGIGFYANSAGTFGFTYKPSAGITDLPLLPGLEPRGIGREGLIVGVYSSSTGAVGFALSGGATGQLTSVAPDGFQTILEGANAAGEVAGWQDAYTPDYTERAVFGSPSAPKTYTYRGRSTTGQAISKNYLFGDYVGADYMGHGFRRAHDGSAISVTAIGSAPGGTYFSAASDNNNAVGTFYSSQANERWPFYYSSTGVLTRLDPNNGAQAVGNGINGVGQLVGWVVTDSLDHYAGFIATCVKTPGTTTCAP